MDSRILEKVKNIQQLEEEKKVTAAQKKAKEEVEHQAYINSKLPEARKWVEERLLDIVAAEIAKPDSYSNAHSRRDISKNKKIISLEYCDKENNGNTNIPTEAKYLAVSEIKGLIAVRDWCPERPDPNSDGVYMIPAGYEYFVTWEQ